MTTRLRAFLYNAIAVACGLAVLFAVPLLAAWNDDNLYREGWQRAVPITIAAAGAVGLVISRRVRARWMAREAIYDSYAAFAAFAKERKGIVLEIGNVLAGHGLGVLRLLSRGRNRWTIRDAYENLHARRRDIGEAAYRTAIDELFAEASSRRNL